MATISIGDALGEGFGLIRKRPLLVLIWGAINTAWTVALGLIMRPSLAGLTGSLKNISPTGAAGQAVSSADTMARLGPVFQLEGTMLVLILASVFISLIFNCAVFRAVLRPEAENFAYMRLGAAELMLFLFLVCAYFAFLIGFVIALIPLALLAAIAGVAHAPALAVLVVSGRRHRHVRPVLPGCVLEGSRWWDR